MMLDKGRSIIVVLKEGICHVIKGYMIKANNYEELDYKPVFSGHN
jgi:hypothetical protein